MTYIKCCDKPNILLFYQGVAHNIRLILLITFLFMQKKKHLLIGMVLTPNHNKGV